MQLAAYPLAAVAGAILSGPAGDAVRAGPATAYTARSWTADDGLQHDVAGALVRSPDGFLWIGTAAGLTRFDGERFREFPLAAAANQGGYNIRALALEAPGSLLALPASGGLVRLRGGDFSEHPFSQRLRGEELLDLYVEPGGAVWVATGASDLVRWENGQMERFGPADGLQRRNGGISFATDAEGATWAAGAECAARYFHGRLTREVHGSGSLLVANGAGGSVWLSDARGLRRLEGGRWTTVRSGSEWPFVSRGVQRLFEDRAGRLWIGTRRDGVYVLRDGVLAAVPSPKSVIMAFAEDEAHNVWFASAGNGIFRVAPKPFVLLDDSTGLPSKASTAVCEDSTGAIWCANRFGGVAKVRGGLVTVFPPPAGARHFYVNTVCCSTDDAVWVGADDGLYRSSGQPGATIERVPIPIRNIRTLSCGRSGEIWIGTAEGQIGFLRENQFHLIAEQPSGASHGVISFCEAADGTVWFAAGRSLFAYRNGRVDRLLAEDRFPGGIIHTVYRDADGAFWIGTDQGLVLWRDRMLRRFTRAEGLPEDMIMQIVEDGSRRMWLAGPKGLVHVSKTELAAVAEGRKLRVAATSFGRDNGLLGATALARCQPSACRSADGRLWFTTYTGLVGIDPSAAPCEPAPPPVYRDLVQIDGRPAPGAGDLRLESGSHRVLIQLAAPCLAAPGQVEVRHQLAGFDSEWVPSGAEQQIRYANLPPATYVFRAQARQHGGAWGPPTALATIRVSTGWWQTRAWRATLAIAFTAAVAAAARLLSHRRLQRQLARLERENAVRRERERIARDLHDELGASLTRIGLLAHRLAGQQSESERRIGAARLAQNARRAAGELESIVWSMSARSESLRALAQFLARYGARFFDGGGIAFRAVGQDHIPDCLLPATMRQAILGVAKEALNNVAKHAHADAVELATGFTGGSFTLLIRDNGIGFDPSLAAAAAGNGLENMRRRAEECGGRLVFNAEPGRGVSVQVTIPLPGMKLRTGNAVGAQS